MTMQFNHDELMLMMLYNTGTRQGLVRELRLTDAEFAGLEFPMN